MKSIDATLEFLEKSWSKIRDLPEYLRAKRIVRKYNSKPKTGYVTREVLDAELTISFYETPLIF